MSQLSDSAASSWPEARPARLAWQWTGGVQGNLRLTALTGLLLLVLLFVEGMTLLRLHALLPVHLFVGLLLIPPVLLKLASTGYRFVRYYTGNRAYRMAGPPQMLLRMIAPPLVAATIGLFGTGVMLLVVGAGGDVWRRLHTLFFLAWFCLMTVHVLAYVWRAPGLAWPDLRWQRGPGNQIAGALTREMLLAGSLLLGLALAIAVMLGDISWIHWVTRFGHDR